MTLKVPINISKKYALVEPGSGHAAILKFSALISGAKEIKLEIPRLVNALVFVIVLKRDLNDILGKS